MSERQLSFFDGPAGAGAAAAPPAAAPPRDPDAEARAFAVDPRNNVVLEASAGTGKTTVLVTRYVNLLKAGVDPTNILAITFTRKAAAEMRERIVGELRTAAERSAFERARWLELRDRLDAIAISTIDAFCLSLLREFPLEADVDPGFELADETEVPRLIGTALDRAMRILVAMAREDPDVSLVLAQLGMSRTRQGLSMLLDRRLVAWDVLDRFLARGPDGLTPAMVCRAAAAEVGRVLASAPGGLDALLADGPAHHPRYHLFLRSVRRLPDVQADPDAAIRGVLERVAAHFLTDKGTARKGPSIAPYRTTDYASPAAARRHRDAVLALAPEIERCMHALDRDLNVILARGVRRMFGVALTQYRQALEERSVLDFSDVLQRAIELLRRMDEFSQSRFRLESRFHHLLVDEFQDTSRAQWELVSLLVQAWGQGAGLAAHPSIFIVGDRKQSIYRFRDAEVAVLQEAARYIGGLRPGGNAERSIARSFRAVPELLRFVNDVFSEISSPARSPEDFTYGEGDRFPLDVPLAHGIGGPVLGLAVADAPEACAAAVAREIVALVGVATVRDKGTGTPRPVRPGDIAILFRSRSSHREFEDALGARGVPTYVYKGLGFFDADEVKDVIALVRYLADPSSSLRAAALLRSRFLRLSDPALARLGPDLAGALLSPELPTASDRLDPEDGAVLVRARAAVESWLARVDRVPPAELVDAILEETAYAFELRGARRAQAWENLKKIRGLVRRIQNRGYTTFQRLADHLRALSAGDESNAAIEALDAVNLMTVHAAKGLEFPIVFVVNLAKGASGPPQPVRVVAGDPGGAAAPSVSVGRYASEADEAERVRERHESRRLLYVAFTRARDRLYLSSVLKDTAFAPGRGSLGDVLPESLRRLLGEAGSAAADTTVLPWTGFGGYQYQWRLCRPVVETDTDSAQEWSSGTLGVSPAPAEESPDDFGVPAAWADTNDEPVSVHASATGLEPREPAPPAPGPGSSDRLVGTVVHRLFAALPPGRATNSRAAVEAAVHRAMHPDEQENIADRSGFVRRVLEIYDRACTRPDVLAALAGDRVHHEVPFSFRPDGAGGRLVRGVIDLVIEKPDGQLAVVELKTGRPEPFHERQLELYVRAARAAFGGREVAGVLLYL